MTTGRAVLLAATLLWLSSFCVSTVASAQFDKTPAITIGPADPPSPDAIEVRLYQQINTGANITLLQSTVVGQEIVIEHHIGLTNLPTITILDEVHPFSGLAPGTYTARWIRHYEYQGDVTDEETPLEFEVPVDGTTTFPVPTLDEWARWLTMSLLAGLLAMALYGRGRRARKT